MCEFYLPDMNNAKSIPSGTFPFTKARDTNVTMEIGPESKVIRQYLT